MPSMVAAASSSGGSSFSLLILLVPVVIMGLLFFSQRRRANATARTQAALQPGDAVRTTSGFLGTLVSLRDGVGEVELAPSLTVRIDARAILPAPTNAQEPAQGDVR